MGPNSGRRIDLPCLLASADQCAASENRVAWGREYHSSATWPKSRTAEASMDRVERLKSPSQRVLAASRGVDALLALLCLLLLLSSSL